jgi:hypothetical protein
MVKARARKVVADVAPARAFNGVKVFTATMVPMRDKLGDLVTDWIAAHPRVTVCDIVVTQSSDDRFHCIAISVFYREPFEHPAAR